MFRAAVYKDIDRIAEIYEHIHNAEEAGTAVVGWAKGVYPTRQTAEDSVNRGDMFVEEINGVIVAAGKINQHQEDEYKNCSWLFEASNNNVMVLHTLVVDPQIKGKGYGSSFVNFYEDYALLHNCRYLRMDTQEKNTAARAFYKKLGFSEAGTVLCEFNGIPNVRLVCLEKKL